MLIIIDMTGENSSHEESTEEKIHEDDIPRKDILEDITNRLPQLQIVEA